MINRDPSPIEVARYVALSLLHKPYLWGGDNPLVGMDCSGLIIEILKSVGSLPAKGDWSAQGLFHYFEKKEIDKEVICEGCLIFWQNKSGVINHVEYAMNDELSLGARGAGCQIVDLKTAIEKDAFIKIRPWKDRPGRFIKGVINPFL